MLRMSFDGHLSNKNSWFTKERLAFSPYTDLKTSTPNYFGIHAWGTRQWFINRNYGGCGADAGWLVFLSPGTGCGWDPSYKFQIKYSRVNTAQKWSTGMYATRPCMLTNFQFRSVIELSYIFR